MTQLAVVYGTALFDLAMEEQQAEEYFRQLSVLEQVLRQEPDFLSLLDARSLPLQQRLELVDKCLGTGMYPCILNFLKLLCRRGIIRELPDCLRTFSSLYCDAFGIETFRAVTAVPMTSELEEKLKNRLEAVTGKTVILQCAVDPSVLGGIRLEGNGRELDGTLRHRLDELAINLAQLVLS